MPCTTGTRRGLTEQYKVSKFFITQEWIKMYCNSTITQWPGQLADFKVETGAMKRPIRAGTCFDTTLLSEAPPSFRAARAAVLDPVLRVPGHGALEQIFCTNEQTVDLP